MKKYKPIICVDFDGVLHSYKSGWKGATDIPDDPVPGAIEWLLDDLLAGVYPENISHFCPDPEVEVCVYSSRSKALGGIKAMKKWLNKHGVDQGYFTDGLITFPTKKPAAFLTIDDRCFCFRGEFPSKDEILKFKPWNKTKRYLNNLE